MGGGRCGEGRRPHAAVKDWNSRGLRGSRRLRDRVILADSKTQRKQTGMLGIDEPFKGRHFGREITILCVRWYLRFKFELPRSRRDDD
jgi:hypothetical protein